MNGSIGVDWVSLVLGVLIVALLVQGYRSAPAGRFGLVLKSLAAILIVLIVGVFAWNTVAVALLRRR
jgi:hypothetical protein